MLSKIIGLISDDLTKVENSLDSFGQVQNNHLSELLGCALGSGGKRIRPALTLLSGKFYNYNLDYLLPMAVAVELLHTATLIHDDVIDKSNVRRGRPTINSVWGEEKAILLGDYMFSKAGEICASTRNLRVIKLFSQTMATISDGELNQSFAAFNLEQNREQYLNQISKKTASLFVLAVESGAILSKAPGWSVNSLREYGYNLGIAFQIVDDILDFTSTEKKLGKPVGSDLAQGTLTLPAILLIERYPEDNPIIKFFQNPNDLDNKTRITELIINSPIIKECYDIASCYCAKACKSLDRLQHNASHQALTDIANYLVERKS